MDDSPSPATLPAQAPPPPPAADLAGSRIAALMARCAALEARLAAAEHHIRVLWGAASDFEEDGAYRRCVLDWRYDPESHQIKVLYGTLLEDGSFEPDDSWSSSPGAGPYRGGGTQAEMEDF